MNDVVEGFASWTLSDALSDIDVAHQRSLQQGLSTAKATPLDTSEREYQPTHSSSATQSITSDRSNCKPSSQESLHPGQRSSTDRPKRRTSFLDLPTELRLAIYDIVFETALQPVVLVRRHCYPLPPVLRASRLLRSEALAQWEAQLNSAQTVQTNITADAFSQRLTADRAVRNLALSAEERQSYMSEIREKHKDTQQRLEDLKALLFFAGWMGQALFYWPRAFPGLYDEDENLDILMVFGDNKDNMDDKL